MAHQAERPPCYRASEAINPTTQSAITAAVIQPTIFSQRDKVKRPITRGLLAKFIITTDDRRHHHPIDDSAPIEHPDRIDRQEVDGRSEAVATASVA